MIMQSYGLDRICSSMVKEQRRGINMLLLLVATEDQCGEYIPGGAAGDMQVWLC